MVERDEPSSQAPQPDQIDQELDQDHEITR